MSENVTIGKIEQLTHEWVQPETPSIPSMAELTSTVITSLRLQLSEKERELTEAKERGDRLARMRETERETMRGFIGPDFNSHPVDAMLIMEQRVKRANERAEKAKGESVRVDVLLRWMNYWLNKSYTPIYEMKMRLERRASRSKGEPK